MLQCLMQVIKRIIRSLLRKLLYILCLIHAGYITRLLLSRSAYKPGFTLQALYNFIDLVLSQYIIVCDGDTNVAIFLQVQALRSVEFYICYYGWGDYKKRENNCPDSDVFKTFSFIVAGIPYMWRLFQVHINLHHPTFCLRSLILTKILGFLVSTTLVR